MVQFRGILSDAVCKNLSSGRFKSDSDLHRRIIRVRLGPVLAYSGGLNIYQPAVKVPGQTHSTYHREGESVTASSYYELKASADDQDITYTQAAAAIADQSVSHVERHYVAHGQCIVFVVVVGQPPCSRLAIGSGDLIWLQAANHLELSLGVSINELYAVDLR